jgi:hypothetical protein
MKSKKRLDPISVEALPSDKHISSWHSLPVQLIADLHHLSP